MRHLRQPQTILFVVTSLPHITHGRTPHNYNISCIQYENCTNSRNSFRTECRLCRCSGGDSVCRAFCLTRAYACAYIIINIPIQIHEHEDFRIHQFVSVNRAQCCFHFGRFAANPLITFPVKIRKECRRIIK